MWFRTFHDEEKSGIRMDLRRLKTELCIQDELLHTLARNLDNEMIMSIITIGCTRV